MKIEIGEELVASWMKHVLGCQIVQKNWKISPEWETKNIEGMKKIFEITDIYFSKELDCKLFKEYRTVESVLNQAECDVIGTKVENNNAKYYGADVAFHQYGLNYNGQSETIRKVINKCIRNAMCLYGFLNIKQAEIYFITPKIGKKMYEAIVPQFGKLNEVFKQKLNLDYEFKLISNDSFEKEILEPLLNKSDIIADDNDLFLRSYQMLNLFTESKETK